MSERGINYDKEIRQQPGILGNLLEAGRPEVEALAKDIIARAPTYGLFAARGSSDNAARYAQYVLGIHNGLTAGLAVPSFFTLYGANPNMKGSLTIGVSQSGQSPDIVGVVKAAAEQGALTVAITNEPESPLAKASTHTIQLRAGVESAVAATKTYTTELMAIAMLSAALQPGDAAWADLAKVPGYVQAVIDANSAIDASAFKEMKHLVVLGRGYNYSTAFETSLKIKETNYLVAEPYSVADLLHGPVAMIGEGFPVLLVAPSGKTHADVPKVLETVKQRGARLIAISDDETILSQAELALRLPKGMPEWVSPIVAVVAGQLFAGALAQANGLDPDKPRGLSKVTLTH
jgi:glucosamine--fructose-6-phosphate aminotransferase (isomerizing)